MSQHQGDENDRLEENHEMEDVNDAVDEGFRGREMDYMALYDDDRYDFMVRIFLTCIVICPPFS